ncbi:MAG: HlyD family secretion protein [Gammaproteobacteria bacterium]
MFLTLKNASNAFIPLIAMLLLTACGAGEDRIQGYMEQDPIQMASLYSGELIQLNVDRGSQVSQGQILFTLDPSPEADQLAHTRSLLREAEAELENAKKGSRDTVLEGLTAEVAKAQASLSIAVKKASRFQQLYEKRAIDAETNDEIQTQVSVDKALLADAMANLREAVQGARSDLIAAQQAKVDSLTADVKQAQWALDQKTVISPIDGHVLETYYRPGEIVATSKPVLSLLNPKRLYAVFFVPEHMLGKLCLGEKVHLSHEGRDEHASARITFISPRAEYTPPVIYSRESDAMLVFKIQATLPEKEAKTFYYGQPVEVYIPRALKCHERS